MPSGSVIPPVYTESVAPTRAVPRTPMPPLAAVLPTTGTSVVRRLATTSVLPRSSSKRARTMTALPRATFLSVYVFSGLH